MDENILKIMLAWKKRRHVYTKCSIEDAHYLFSNQNRLAVDGSSRHVDAPLTRSEVHRQICWKFSHLFSIFHPSSIVEERKILQPILNFCFNLKLLMSSLQRITAKRKNSKNYLWFFSIYITKAPQMLVDNSTSLRSADWSTFQMWSTYLTAVDGNLSHDSL